MKISRDPITGYATVKIADMTIVLKKKVRSDFLEKPANEVVECAI